MWSEELGMTKVLFNTQQVVKQMTYNMIDQKYIKTAFINNNTFSGCLHSNNGV